MSVTPPLVSVVVPCYNKAEYIVETLDSILSQTYPHWECVIVNDGSKDNTQQIVEGYIKNDARFRLINIPNSGVSVARNTAITHSNGTYLFPLDADDKIDARCISICLKEFEKRPDLKLVCPQGQLFGMETGLWNLPPFDYKTMLKYNMIHNSSLFLKKDFQKTGGYRTNMVHGLEDWDFFIALLHGSSKEHVVTTEEPLFYYRVNNKGRRLTVAGGSGQSEMMDLIVYNNFSIYREYFPDIFTRIHAYDFQKTMLEKRPVKWLIGAMIGLSSWKNKLTGKKIGNLK
jgi:glycosyltransferase involved in cell wall biosynthesis